MDTNYSNNSEKRKSFYENNFATEILNGRSISKKDTIKSSLSNLDFKTKTFTSNDNKNTIPLMTRKRKFENIIKLVPSLQKEKLNLAKFYEGNSAYNGNNSNRFTVTVSNLNDGVKTNNINNHKNNLQAKTCSFSKQKFIDEMLNKNPLKILTHAERKEEYKTSKHNKTSNSQSIYNKSNYSNLLTYKQNTSRLSDKITNSFPFYNNTTTTTQSGIAKFKHAYHQKQTYFI